MKTIIDLTNIFKQQIELDKHIHLNHNLNYNGIHDELKLSLAVELGELANEVRCFKFWSYKKPSERNIILEEYVDGIHFVTSLAIAKNIKHFNNWKISFNQKQYSKKEISILFNKLFSKINLLNNKLFIKKWYKNYIRLGFVLGFSFDEIKNGYEQKNIINHKRQDDKY